MTAARREDADARGEVERPAPRVASEPTALGDDDLFSRFTAFIWDGAQSATAPPIDPGVRAVARAE